MCGHVGFLVCFGVFFKNSFCVESGWTQKVIAHFSFTYFLVLFLR